MALMQGIASPAPTVLERLTGVASKRRVTQIVISTCRQTFRLACSSPTFVTNVGGFD
jgi:hypothetical protein